MAVAYPASPRSEPLPEAEVIAALRAGGPALVALSGGVDSAVVAALAHAARPEAVRTATLTGPAVAPAEVERAARVARLLGVPHDLVPVDPLAVDGYRSNPVNRCYFCRTTEAAALQAFGRRHGIVRYLDGVHVDDLGDDRPGLRALAEAGFEHPLLAAGWGKRRVRAYARDRGLPNWDAPSDSCLASRVPTGTPIEGPTLTRIAEAEATLRARGYRRVRVRLEGTGARVEVDAEEVGRLTEARELEAVRAALRTSGFSSVRADPRGYRDRANS